MERLLRDGGDLDSMDRSLLDYGATSNNLIRPGGAGTKVSSAMPSGYNSPPSVGNNGNGSLNRTPSATPVTSPTSYKSENGGEVIVSPQQANISLADGVNKREVMVHYTEKSNKSSSVVQSAVVSGGGGHDDANGANKSTNGSGATVLQQQPPPSMTVSGPSDAAANPLIDAAITESTGERIRETRKKNTQKKRDRNRVLSRMPGLFFETLDFFTLD